MKLKITRPDGTILEVDGTPEECAKVALGINPLTLPAGANPLAHPSTPLTPCISPPRGIDVRPWPHDSTAPTMPRTWVVSRDGHAIVATGCDAVIA